VFKSDLFIIINCSVQGWYPAAAQHQILPALTPLPNAMRLGIQIYLQCCRQCIEHYIAAYPNHISDRVYHIIFTWTSALVACWCVNISFFVSSLVSYSAVRNIQRSAVVLTKLDRVFDSLFCSFSFMMEVIRTCMSSEPSAAWLPCFAEHPAREKAVFYGYSAELYCHQCYQSWSLFFYFLFHLQNLSQVPATKLASLRRLQHSGNSSFPFSVVLSSLILDRTLIFASTPMFRACSELPMDPLLPTHVEWVYAKKP